MEKFLSKMLINRPLVFLCGVAIPNNPEAEKRDRRLILKKEITNRTKIIDNNKNIIYQVMPIIVDFILNDKVTKGMSMSLLEEIVSAISCKTYIFLDSMATSYELGLFTNSNTANDVRVLVGKGYKTRANCQIGVYIQKAHKDFVEYTVEYNEKGFSYFFNDQIPEEISKVIDIDIKNIKEQETEVDIRFSCELNSEADFGTIFVSSNIHKLKFQISIKTLFYIVDAIMRTDKKISLSNSTIISTIEKIRNNLFYNYVSNIENENVEVYVFKKPVIDIVVPNYDLNKIIKHILCVILAIRENNKNGRFPTNISLPTYYKFTNLIHIEKDYRQIINKLFNVNSVQEKMLNDYKTHPELFCRSFIMRIHKKKKKMITYKDNHKGRELRKIHCNIKEVTEMLFESSKLSYAYKKDLSILKCLNEHSKSTLFYKLDISKFFDSISKSNLKNKYIELFNNMYKNVFPSSKKDIFNKYLSRFLDACFYNNHVPIGYVASPILSDIYLNNIDRKLEKKKAIITRYADDYLVSTFNLKRKSLDGIINQLTSLLKEEGLELNKEKILTREFKYNGDSIKFLGVNIVYDKANNVNKFTVSRKYIEETSKMLYEAIKNNNYVLFDKCQGRINYIKEVSKESYNKFIKIFTLRTGIINLPSSLDGFVCITVD